MASGGNASSLKGGKGGQEERYILFMDTHGVGKYPNGLKEYPMDAGLGVAANQEFFEKEDQWLIEMEIGLDIG